MTKSALRLDDVLTQDADDVTRIALHLTAGEKIAAVKELAGYFSALNEIARMKALLFLQAALSSLTTQTLPAGTAASIVDHVYPVALRHGDARRVALQVLALVFLRSREITPSIDALIRTVFKAASSDRDASVREFARMSLSRKGALQRRAVTSRGRRIVEKARAVAVPVVNLARVIKRARPAAATGKRVRPATTTTHRKTTS